MTDGNAKLVLLPVRRRLMAVTLFYLCGVFLSVRFALSVYVILILCALLLGLAALRLAARKGAVLCFCGIFLLLGNALAGRELLLRDLPTGTRTAIEGTVTAIEKEHRVVLQDVVIEGERRLSRRAVVSLLPPKGKDMPAAPTPMIGQRVKGTGRLFAPDEPRNPGGMNGRYRALARGYELSGYLQDGWQTEGESTFSLGQYFRQKRLEISAKAKRLFGDRAALFLGVMLGDRSELDEEITRALQWTGTAHILTVSGLHLSMVALAAGWLLDRVTLGRKRRFAALSVFLLAFTGLTGSAAGTVRAMIMALLREYARLRGRRYEPLTALSCAALLMALVNPVWPLDASYQFSFFVVLGIVLLSGGVAEMKKRRRQTLSRRRSVLRGLLSIAGVSLCAQIAALPMQLLLYGYVPILSLPMNLLCGWLMPFVLLGGWVSVLISMASFPLARIAACAAALPAMLFEMIGMHAASFSHAIVRLPAPFPATVFLFALLMMLLSRRIRFGRLRGAAAAVLVALVMLTYCPRLDPRPRYVQLDVGQGDAALFREGRSAVIIDVGPEDSYDLLRYLRHEGLFVEAVVLSHLDTDHAGALELLMDSEIHIPAVVLPRGTLEQMRDDPVIMRLMQEERLALHEVGCGDLLEIGNLSMTVLAPRAFSQESNEQSLVLQAHMAGVSFLLTGDLPAESEPEYLPKCDVLKVAHHGSKNATSEALLERVRPELAIISVGEENWYGHPHRDTLKRLEAIGARTMRTDRQGCITLWLQDGEMRADAFLDRRSYGL